jgi:hypothetical protein
MTSATLSAGPRFRRQTSRPSLLHAHTQPQPAAQWLPRQIVATVATSIVLDEAVLAEERYRRVG